MATLSAGSPLTRTRPPSNGAYYTASVLYNAGFRGWPLTVMTAIAGRESTWNPSSLNNNPNTSDYSVGLFQINYFGDLLQSRTQQYGSPAQLQSSPDAQARAAYNLAGGNSLSGLSNWALAASPAAGQAPTPTVQGYSITPWLPQAAAAAAAVGTFGPAPASQTGSINSWPSSGGPSVMAGGYGSGATQATLTSAPGGTGCSAKGSVFTSPKALIVAGPQITFTYCNLKAMVGGLALVAGGAIAIVGVGLIIVAATGNKIPGPVGKGVAAVPQPSASEFKASPTRSGSASSHAQPFTEADESIPKRNRPLRETQEAA